MKPAQVEALIAGYRVGRTMEELGTDFGIDRRTVSAYLRRAGVDSRRGRLDPDQLIDAVRLYEAGWSSGRLGDRFGVSADSVLKALGRAGVAIRSRRGGPASKRPRH